MVLQAEVRDLIAERDEEVVAAIVARLIERAGLMDEFVELVDVLVGECDVLGAVAGEIEVVFGGYLRGEGDLDEPAAGEDGGVDELLEGDGLEGVTSGLGPPVGSSAVPNFQSAGILIDGETMMSATFWTGG